MLGEHSDLCCALKPLDFEVVKLHYKLLLREERDYLIYGDNKSGVTEPAPGELGGTLHGHSATTEELLSSLAFQGSCRASELYSLYPSRLLEGHFQHSAQT